MSCQAAALAATVKPELAHLVNGLKAIVRIKR